MGGKDERSKIQGLRMSINIAIIILVVSFYPYLRKTFKALKFI
jgi:hypothetical protein